MVEANNNTLLIFFKLASTLKSMITHYHQLSTGCSEYIAKAYYLQKIKCLLSNFMRKMNLKKVCKNKDLRWEFKKENNVSSENLPFFLIARFLFFLLLFFFKLAFFLVESVISYFCFFNFRFNPFIWLFF